MTDGTFWYTVCVQIITEDGETGKIKKTKEYSLVRAVSVTDAEAKVVKAFENMRGEQRIVNVTESKITEVIQ